MKNKNLNQLFDLLDTMPNPVSLNELNHDENGEAYDKIVYVNKSFLKSIGYSTKDIPDDKIWFAKAYPDPAYQHYISTEWFKAVSKAKEEDTDLTGFPAKVRCKDGQDLWFNITTQLSHPIGDKYRTIVFVQTSSPEQTKIDLDKKSLELLHEKRLLKTIINSAPIRIFWKDIDGRFLGCNKAFLEDAQLEKEEDIIGKTDYDMIWKNDALMYRMDDKHVQELGVAKLNYVEPQTQGNGNTIILSTSKVPLIDRSGKRIGILGLYQDITQEYKRKEKIEEQEKLLIMQSRQAAMGEMISMIAHQWKQPLSSIAAVAMHMQVQYDLGTSSPEDLAEQSEVILNQTEYLSQTISDFRNFFKTDKTCKDVQARAVIDDALLIIKELLKTNQIELKISCLSTKYFTTYPKELQQVFINLIKNSSDALEDQGLEEKWIKISTKDSDEFVCIEISDNAGGIKEDIIDRIFEPYFSTKDEKNGTGLGLYMSQVIIEKHLQGTLSCKNRGEGAVFTVRLPLDFKLDSSS